MVKVKNLLPPDPRPSKAHPEERQRRKQLEKEHGYGWVPPVVLGLLGLTLAYDVTRDVEKCEKRKEENGEQRDRERDESEETARRRRRERRRAELRSRSDRRYRGGSEGDSWEEEDTGYGGSDRGSSRKDRDGGLSRADRLEKGEGGPWDRDRERERDRRRSSVYEADDYYDEDRPRRRGKDGDDDYYDYDRGRRTVEERRGRPRMRRHSSDW